MQVQNDQIEAVLTVGEQEINYINLLIKEMEEEQKNQIREESSKPNQIIANGWNKSRIAVTSCGILVVLLGVLYGYMNHHNLTFSNVLHAYY